MTQSLKNHKRRRHPSQGQSAPPRAGLRRLQNVLFTTSIPLISLMSPGCEANPKGAGGAATNSAAPPPLPQPGSEPQGNLKREPQVAPLGASEPAVKDCPKGTPSPPLFRVEAPALTEISGVVSSLKSPGLLWAHNDSGDGGNVYALDLKGRLVGSAQLSVPALDWEDIARYRSPEGADYLYVADTGDNTWARREGVSIHRFKEPTLEAVRASHPKPVLIKPETLRVTYPDGPKDVEALLVDPLSGNIALISKPPLNAPGVYSVEFGPHFRAELRGTITGQSAGHPVAHVTAADISPDGRFILLRTYGRVFLFRRQLTQSIFEALLGAACSYPGPAETQGESIAFVLQAGAKLKGAPPPYLTVSEGLRPSLFHSAFESE